MLTSSVIHAFLSKLPAVFKGNRNVPRVANTFITNRVWNN